jgi:hypothetical protein
VTTGKGMGHWDKGGPRGSRLRAIEFSHTSGESFQTVVVLRTDDHAVRLNSFSPWMDSVIP